MILINVRFTVKPDRADDWLDFARPFTEATRAEPGNLWFDWYRSVDDPTEFFLCEAFREGDAPGEHVGSDHFAAFTAAAISAPWSSSPSAPETTLIFVAIPSAE